MSYPSIKDENFQKKIATKFKSFKLPKKQPSFTELCFPKKYSVQPQQEFVAKFINPSSPYKGLLVFHRIGAGKTCAAIQIGEAWKNKKRIIVVLPASLIGNFYKELRNGCSGSTYISQTDKTKLDLLSPSTEKYKEIIEKVNRKIEEVYSIYSYHKYVKLVLSKKLDLTDALLIIDEVQNIVSESGLFYDTIYKSIHKAPTSLRVILMSATPIFDRPSEIGLTINLLRPPELLPVGTEFNNTFISYKNEEYSIKNKNILRKLTTGLISYFPGAEEYAFPEQTFKLVKCYMSNYQFKSYKVSEEKHGDNIFKDILKLPNNFLIGLRSLSNIAFPNRLTGSDGFESFKDNSLELDRLKKYSTKFYKLMINIKKSDGPIFIYSNFLKYVGINSIIKILEYHGYKNVLTEGVGKNRFALWTGDEKNKDKEYVINVFNQYKNKDGDLIKIILGSPAMKEGVSLLRIREIHIIDPYWNMSRLQQIFGRGIRFCSHRDLPIDDRKVMIYLYISLAPKGNTKHTTVDEHILDMAKRKDNLINQFYDILQTNAIDYGLFNRDQLIKRIT